MCKVEFYLCNLNHIDILYIFLQLNLNITYMHLKLICALYYIDMHAHINTPTCTQHNIHTCMHMHTHICTKARTHMQGQIRTPHTDLHGIIRVLRPVSVVCYYGPTGLSNHHLNTIWEHAWHGRPVLHTITFSVIIPPGVQLQIMIRDSEWLPLQPCCITQQCITSQYKKITDQQREDLR